MPRLHVDFYSQALSMNTNAAVLLPQSQKDFISGGARYNGEGKIPVQIGRAHV